MRFDKKVATVTGGGSGMGEATARRLAAEGAAVVVGDVNTDGGERVAAEIVQAGGTAVFQRTDVTDDASVRAMVKRALTEYGSLEVAANIAGVPQQPIPFLQSDDAALWDRVHAVNERGVYYSIRAAAEHMVTAGGGAITTVASLAGIRPFPSLTVYTASKHAAVGIILNAASELIRDKVRVNGIAPGSVNTPMLATQPEEVLAAIAAAQPLGRLGTPEEIASVVAFLLSDDASFVAGQIIAVDGGWDNSLSGNG